MSRVSIRKRKDGFAIFLDEVFQDTRKTIDGAEKFASKLLSSVMRLKNRKRTRNPLFRVPASKIINNQARELAAIYDVPISTAEKVLRDVGRDFAGMVDKTLKAIKKV